MQLKNFPLQGQIQDFSQEGGPPLRNDFNLVTCFGSFVAEYYLFKKATGLLCFENWPFLSCIFK